MLKSRPKALRPHRRSHWVDVLEVCGGGVK